MYCDQKQRDDLMSYLGGDHSSDCEAPEEDLSSSGDASVPFKHRFYSMEPRRGLGLLVLQPAFCSTVESNYSIREEGSRLNWVIK